MLQLSKVAGNSGLAHRYFVNAQAEEPRGPARIIGNQLSSHPTAQLGNQGNYLDRRLRMQPAL